MLLKLRNKYSLERKKRLPGRRNAVTIAAFFRFDEGVILCADSEYTHQTLKLYGPKIFPINYFNLKCNVSFALAGTINYAVSAVQAINRKLRSLGFNDSFGPSDLYAVIEDELVKFHHKHIYKHPLHGYTGGPDFGLLIVAKCNNHPVTVWATSETAVTEMIIEDFRAIGSGQEMASYVVRPLSYRPFRYRHLRELVLVSTHMLYQVKKYVQGCGNVSTFMVIGNNGEFHQLTTWNLLPVDTYSEVFEKISADMFFAAADLNMNDSLVSYAVELSDKRIKEVRKQQRAEVKKREEFMKKIQMPMVEELGSKLLEGKDRSSNHMANGVKK